LMNAQLGIHQWDDFSIEQLVDYIDWTPLFSSWELAGKFPDILTDEIVGKVAQSLYNDARSMLRQIIDEKWLKAKAVIGLFPANSNKSDEIELTIDDQIVKLHCLRQQLKKTAGQPNFCLSDFVAPTSTGYQDYFGSFAVTAGIGIEEHVSRFEKAGDDYSAILLKALADRLAEAMAEKMHEIVRKKLWGYAKDENLDNYALIHEKYKGIRPAPGYPACPDHTEKSTLFDMLQVTERIGIKLTESFAMYPASSVSGWYIGHPESKYFGLGDIAKDQVIEYAERKSFSLEDMEKWLSPVLNYERA